MNINFDFGIEKVKRHDLTTAGGRMWSWSITLRGDRRTWHVVRRTGNLKVWA